MKKQFFAFWFMALVMTSYSFLSNPIFCFLSDHFNSAYLVYLRNKLFTSCYSPFGLIETMQYCILIKGLALFIYSIEDFLHKDYY